MERALDRFLIGEEYRVTVADAVIDRATYVGAHESAGSRWHRFRCEVRSAFADAFERAWSSAAMIELLGRRAGGSTFELCIEARDIERGA